MLRARCYVAVIVITIESYLLRRALVYDAATLDNTPWLPLRFRCSVTFDAPMAHMPCAAPRYAAARRMTQHALCACYAMRVARFMLRLRCRDIMRAARARYVMHEVAWRVTPDHRVCYRFSAR